MYDQLLWRIREEFVEHLQIGEQIGYGHAKTSPGPKTNFVGLESEKTGNLVPNSEKFEKLDLPGHCYGSSKNGPYGRQGPWAQPLFNCVAVPSGVLFREKTRSRK